MKNLSNFPSDCTLLNNQAFGSPGDVRDDNIRLHPLSGELSTLLCKSTFFRLMNLLLKNQRKRDYIFEFR